eukprot:scaffold31704_cov61-Phaeocystis_antarctica.AAC.5
MRRTAWGGACPWRVSSVVAPSTPPPPPLPAPPASARRTAPPPRRWRRPRRSSPCCYRPGSASTPPPAPADAPPRPSAAEPLQPAPPLEPAPLVIARRTAPPPRLWRSCPESHLCHHAKPAPCKAWRGRVAAGRGSRRSSPHCCRPPATPASPPAPAAAPPWAGPCGPP